MRIVYLSAALCCFLILTPRLIDAKCKESINLYDDFKCKPIYKHGHHHSCPDAFDCRHITKDNNKCFYNGVYYNVGDIITEYNQNLPGCVLNCTCSPNLEFDCRVYTCQHNPPPTGCYETYNLRRCCPNGFHCPNSDTLKCKGINNRKFLYGNTFDSPSVSCAICECYPGYTGKPNDPHCKKAICDAELYLSLLVQSYCAPLYLIKGDCCPMAYMCPSDEDDWDDYEDAHCSGPASSSFSSSSSTCTSSSTSSSEEINIFKCRYGDNYFNIGSRFKRGEVFDNTILYSRCECRIPPYFSCVRDPVPPDDP